MFTIRPLLPSGARTLCRTATARAPDPSRTGFANVNKSLKTVGWVLASVAKLVENYGETFSAITAIFRIIAAALQIIAAVFGSISATL